MPGQVGPLSEAEVNRLESTLLPALERHHLRLLAHALRTLQQVQHSQAGPGDSLPAAESIEQWLVLQPGTGNDAAFAHQLARRLHQAGQQLEALAGSLGMEPLALDLDQLISWAQQQAAQRLIKPPHTTPQQPPAEPPEPR
ncbi:MAG: hypothetical protein VKL97_02355 [Cyanobacteriota bacterium]|nr:hypothetical protein [Cyanobacteriota bacterium]